MKAFFFSEFEAFGCSLDAGGGAGPEVCSGRDGRDAIFFFGPSSHVS